MENNEISMFIDVKLSINDKRADVLKFKTWTRCQVKIEAIKCLPSYLRITFMPCNPEESTSKAEDVFIDSVQEKSLTVLINVPGVSISLAASRTKMYSYGLFWTKNRRECFIYFALDTETSCRHHMKWVKKSIKNLELHRQLCLEERRNSRGPGRFGVHAQDVVSWKVKTNEAGSTMDLSATRTAPVALGPLPQIPAALDANSSSWSQRVSRVSNIYEEIFEGSTYDSPPRLSRRLSRSSIASGIYEEMKSSASNFNAIAEEILNTQLPPTPPPLPSLIAQRKRINTFETEQHTGLLGEIPRSNTNPESELAKKKKYKNVLNNIFGSGRSKRAKSVSESHTCSAEDVITCGTSKQSHVATSPVYENDIIAIKNKQLLHSLLTANVAESKRNSYSSPDLSKINFFDTFDESQLLSSQSLDESAILPGQSTERHLEPAHSQKVKAGSLESFNISQAIPHNFNISACNTSTINLIGSHGAAPLRNPLKNNLLIDDLTGYCVMAPIRPKRPTNALSIKEQSIEQQVLPSTEFTSSSYSTVSYCTTTSSCTNTTDTVQLYQPAVIPESVIYENIQDYNIHSGKEIMSTPPVVDFPGNLYENLLAAKAAQELEQLPMALSTSTPTDSPLTAAQTLDCNVVAPSAQAEEEGENYYQTPRKSIISVDDKVPSYYPNSCDTIRTRRMSQSPSQGAPAGTFSEKTPNSIGMRQLEGIKMRRERKENLDISPHAQLNEQRHNAETLACSTETNTSNKSHKSMKTKKTAAHKISENVYAVFHANKKTSNNNKCKKATESPGAFSDDMRAQLQQELLQLAILQNIDFKFDDTKVLETTPNSKAASEVSQLKVAIESPVEAAENRYQVINETAAHLLHKYSQFSPAKVTPQRLTAQHHLQLNQEANMKRQSPIGIKPNSTGSTPSAGTAVSAMTQSKLEVPLAAGDLQWSGVKKFASLPRFKKIDFSPLKLKIHNVLQRNHQHEF